MMFPLRIILLPGILIGAAVAFAQLSAPVIPVDLPSSFTIQYQPMQASQCYRVPRPADGGITAGISGYGDWDICIGDQQCPSSCTRTSQRTATAYSSTRGSYYFVRVISWTPGMTATLSINQAASAATTNVTGTWTVVFKGQTSTTMTLEQSGEQVTGNMVTTDGTPGYITGTLVGSTLTLQRNAGMNTVQHYQVVVQGDSFSGTFRNEGRIADNGAFTGTRSTTTGAYAGQTGFGRQASALNVSGTWTVTFKGQTRTTMTLEQSGQQVTGNLATTDGTPGYVTGTLAGSTLTLQRNAGMNTVQYYQVTVQGDSFSGIYRNQGRIADSGAFTGVRALNVSGTWTVVFKGQTSTTMTLQQSGDQITGNLVTMDGSQGYVSDNLVGSTLRLARNTGMNTMQYFEALVQGDSFSGTYRNEGRIADNGTFTGLRGAGSESYPDQIGLSGRMTWGTNVAGTWTVVFKGQTRTTLTLEQSGEQITGNLVTTDGTPGYVTGTLVGSTLTLQRNAGTNTIQYYQAVVQGNSFSGNYRNEGRIADSGTFTGSRTAGSGGYAGQTRSGRLAPSINVTGTWAVVFQGQTRMTMVLEQSGDLVTGNLVTTDGSQGNLSGSLVGSTLTLSRNTGMNTIQNYQLTVQGDSFSGTYRNQGRISDSGTITGSRAPNVSGTWNVVFKGQIRTVMTLEQVGEQVTGNLITTDGSAGYVTGRFVNPTLTLSRDTGMDSIQRYQVTVQGNSFSGSYRNEGRYSDSGTFTGTRR